MDLQMTDNSSWLLDSITAGDCIVVADGSFMREVTPFLCLTAFILECQSGQDSISGSFAEYLTVVSAFRGELLGLIAIHLLLRVTYWVKFKFSPTVREHSTEPSRMATNSEDSSKMQAGWAQSHVKSEVQNFVRERL